MAYHLDKANISIDFIYQMSELHNMVYYLGTQRLIELTTTVSLEYILLGIIQSMEEDFLNWQHFSLVPRHATFGEHGVIELMVVNNQKDYAFKYVNGHPNNTQQQLLSVTGFGVLSQMENGYPTFISEMTLLTAMQLPQLHLPLNT